MKKNSKKITAVTMTGAVLLAAPIAMNAAPMMSAQTDKRCRKDGLGERIRQMVLL